MAKSLDDLEKFSKDLEKERINAYAGIKRQINDLGARTESLGKEASNLSAALEKALLYVEIGEKLRLEIC